MSTPANIAELDEKGRLHIVNVAMDGYPNQGGAGNVLLNAYRSPYKVHQLVSLGNLAHVGFTPKQANVYKEAGNSWSEYTGVKNQFSGKGQKEQMKWYQDVGHYTHAFQRDWGRGHSENGTLSNVKYPSTYSAMLDVKKKAPLESNYNYIFNDKNKKWYFNKQSSFRLKPLSDVVNLHDRAVVHKEYQQFQANPVNPHLPKLDASQIHSMINEAINGPKNDPTYSLKNKINFEKGTLDANANAVKNIKNELKDGGLSTEHKLQLQGDLRADANPNTKKRLATELNHNQAQVANLKRIDKFVNQHPDEKLYPNDLKLSRNMGRYLQQRANQPEIWNHNQIQNYFDKHGMGRAGQSSVPLEADTKAGPVYTGFNLNDAFGSFHEDIYKGMHATASSVKSGAFAKAMQNMPSKDANMFQVFDAHPTPQQRKAIFNRLYISANKYDAKIRSKKPSVRQGRLTDKQKLHKVLGNSMKKVNGINRKNDKVIGKHKQNRHNLSQQSSTRLMNNVKRHRDFKRKHQQSRHHDGQDWA